MENLFGPIYSKRVMMILQLLVSEVKSIQLNWRYIFFFSPTDMITSSQEEQTNIEPVIIVEIPVEQTTTQQPSKETLTDLESEINLQNSETNIKVKKAIVDHQDNPTENLLGLGESSDNLKGVLSRTQNEVEDSNHQSNLQLSPIVQLTTTEEPQTKVTIGVENQPNIEIHQRKESVVIQAKDENEIINMVDNNIETKTEKLKEVPTTEEFKSMELLTEKPSAILTKINPVPENLQSIEPKSNIQRKEKLQSFGDIISNTLLAIYESQPKKKENIENKEIKEIVPKNEIVAAVNPNENLSSELNYKAKSTKRSISDEFNRNGQMIKNFGPTAVPKKRNLLEKLENETSAERQERWNKSLQHMMTAVSVMGKIDNFISSRIKSGVQMVARMYDAQDDQIRQRRNSFF